MINLVLITSVINTPNKQLSYSKIRSVFNRNERFKQTKKTIKTAEVLRLSFVGMMFNNMFCVGT